MGKAILVTSAAGLMAIGAAGQVSAQTQQGRPAISQQTQDALLRIREARYQIGQMERVLEGAVEHGAAMIRDRLLALMPADMLLAENARARGFRLDGYGVFFDVEVPSLEGSLTWSLRTLDQNSLGLDSAVRTVRTFIDGAAANDVNLQQALKRIELQMTSGRGPLQVGLPTPGARQAVGSAAVAPGDPADDPILHDPDEAYRRQVREALTDAMLEHSRGLAIQDDEWLTVAARGSADRVRVAPVDTDSRTVVLRVRGSDLTAFLGGRLPREEARMRVEVRVF
jgi:hypothetical protein